ncbi:hypothetical protein [Nocardioides dilutus]
MTDSSHESTAAWGELLDTLRDLDKSFLDGDRAVADDRHVADGYRALATTLGVAFDTYLFAEPSRPIFMELNTPFRRDRRWGGDNTDAFYRFAMVDPARRYRISGNKGDAIYFALTGYNEPAPGTWSDKIVLHLNDTDMGVDANGDFSFEIGPVPDIAALVTRDYQVDPLTGRPVTWQIEALEPPDPIRHGDAETAAALRASAAWLRTMFMIIPLTIGVRSEEQSTQGHEVANAANTMGPPYQVPDANFGWSARDACYSFGSYDLAEDEALVITHRPPEVRFWSFCVWNQFMANHSAGDGRTSVNIGSAVPNADGTVTIVLAHGQATHPNAVTTMDYPRGNLAFRWFLPDAVPAPPEVSLVKLADAPMSCTT